MYTGSTPSFCVKWVFESYTSCLNRGHNHGNKHRSRCFVNIPAVPYEMNVDDLLFTIE